MLPHKNACDGFYRCDIWVLSIKYRIQFRLNRWNNLFMFFIVINVKFSLESEEYRFWFIYGYHIQDMGRKIEIVRYSHDST